MKKTTRRRRDGATVLGFLVFFSLLLYGGGCAKEDVKFADSTPTSAQTGENTDDAKNSASEKNEKFSSKTDSERENDAAKALGDATDKFSQIFSDEVGAQTSSDWDASLVDEETKKKFSADRTSVAPILAARETKEGEAERPKFRLEYKFAPNSSLSWNVVHQVRKKISYGGRTRSIETSSTTFRRWEFADVDPAASGKIAARHWIDRLILRQNEEEKEPIDFDSERDLVVPKEISAFGTEKAIGVALETFNIDPFGVMSEKKKLVQEYQGREDDSSVLVPFPKEEVAVGDVWTVPYALYLKGADGLTRAYRVVERFRLENVDDKLASITFKTTLMSIVDDPVVEGALAERLFIGRALFDRERGTTLRTELNFEKTVPGAFGDSSFLEYHCQVVEKLIDSAQQKTSDKSAAPPEKTNEPQT